MLSEGSGDLPMQAQAAMILGVSTAMLGQSMSGTTGDTVKQRIRAASKGFGISNLNFTSNVGSGKLGKVDMNQSSENFMKSMLKHFKMAGGKTGGGDKPDTDGGGGDPAAPPAAAGLKAELEADLGKDASQMKNEIMQSGATGIIDPEKDPWCAAYVNSQLTRQGIMGSGSPAADSYADWGAKVDKSKIKYGDVLVGDYGGGPKTHVMFAAGSPKDGAVDIIGGNQSGKVSRGRIQLNKIAYARRASDSVVLEEPGQAEPLTKPKPELIGPPEPDSVTPVKPKEAESGGSFNLLNPFSWGKLFEAKEQADKGQGPTYKKGILGSALNRNRMLQEARGYGGGGSDATVKKEKPKLNVAAAMAFLDAKVKRDNLGDELLSKNIQPRTAQITGTAGKAKPVPLKKTPEQVIPPRQPAAASTTAAVVTPPIQNVSKKTASAAGSFGSSIPSAKVAAGNFADFLYLDLV